MDSVDCSDPTANYRVLAVLDDDQHATCDGTPGLTATDSVSYYGAGSGGYTLCLGDT